MHRSRLTAIFLLILILVLTGGCWGEDKIYRSEFDFPEEDEKKLTINLGNIPSETVIHRLRDYAPLVKIIEENLEVNIQQTFSADYEGIVNNMLREKYDIALLAPLAYARYHNRAETPVYRPIVQPIRFGEDFYRGIIFTGQNTGIETINDLKNRNIAFVDEDSASGYLFPRARFMQEGIIPEDYFSVINFFGRHDLVVRAVYTGQMDAGATYDDARPGNIPGEENPDEVLPVIAKTEKIPTEPTVINENFRRENPELSEKIIELLVKLHKNGEGQQALEQLEVDRFIKTEDATYDVVREVINILQQK